MYTPLGYIMGKPSDYIVCKDCNSINWYENEECHCCGHNKFTKNKKIRQKAIHDEIDFWTTEEGYTFEEAQDIMISV